MRRLRLLGAAATGYALGTLPSGDAAARLAGAGGRDLRSAGTGNPGAANAMVVLGKGWGYGVLAADIAKGAGACALGRRLAGDLGAHVAGTAAVVGHCYPAWNGFRGGKGVATSVGQCLMTFPAYLPADLLLAWAVATRPWKCMPTYPTTVVGSLAWILASVVWWRRGWPNAWGPSPTAALPAASAASTAVILSRFARPARTPP